MSQGLLGTREFPLDIYVEPLTSGAGEPLDAWTTEEMTFLRDGGTVILHGTLGADEAVVKIDRCLDSTYA
jgi:hypothetical protein